MPPGPCGIWAIRSRRGSGVDEAIALAQELAHPYSVAYALYFAAVLHCLRREAPAAQARAEEVIALARQQEFPGMVARGTVPRGWALAAQGQGTEGITQMCQGVDAQRTMGAEVERPVWSGHTGRGLWADRTDRRGAAFAG